MQHERIKEEKVLIRIKKLDSMGRTAEVRRQMEQNDPKPLRIDPDTQFIHDTVAEVCVDYPRAMYRLALRNGLPAGDIANPDYPLPFDLAQQLGLTEMGFRVIGKNKDSAGNVVVRLPYVTKTVRGLNPDLTLDLDACRKEEAELRRLGWVDSPNKIKGLPVAPAEQPFDSLPGDESNNGNGRAVSTPSNQTQQPTFKETVSLESDAQRAIQTAGEAALKNPAESNGANGIKPKSKRGGYRPGSGRKPLARAAR